MPSTPPRSLVTHLELVITSKSTIFTNFLIWCVSTGETDSSRTCLKVTAINNHEGCIRAIYFMHNFFFFFVFMERKYFFILFEFAVRLPHHIDKGPGMHMQMSERIRI